MNIEQLAQMHERGAITGGEFAVRSVMLMDVQDLSSSLKQLDQLTLEQRTLLDEFCDHWHPGLRTTGEGLPTADQVTAVRTWLSKQRISNADLAAAQELIRVAGNVENAIAILRTIARAPETVSH
ncbi:MAG: hypothetical protein KDA58_05135 [Planctomycetaceae bacterium]|nr:hypothetical protein [Planctomycetaceae bacterium]